MLEYKTLFSEPGPPSVENLNRLAQEGWELVLVMSVGPGIDTAVKSGYVVYLKREISPKG